MGKLKLKSKHRVLCGDATVASDVEGACGGSKVDMLLTDPPYNVGLGYNESAEQAAKRNRRTDGKTVSNDLMDDAAFRVFLVDAFSGCFEALKPGASFYVWHADSEGYNFRGAIRDIGEETRQCLIWSKQALVMGRQDYHWQHEPCLYDWKKGAAHGWYTDRKQSTLLKFDRPSQSTAHPTMKPIALFAYLVGNSTAPQGVILDPFMGSCTTIMAAEQLGRRAVGLELDPTYCDVIVRRWEAATGQQATLEETGETFAQVAEGRGVAAGAA